MTDHVARPEFVVKIMRGDDLPTLTAGPFPFAHTASRYAARLQSAMVSAAHVEGTEVVVADFDPATSIDLPLHGKDAYTLADRIMAEPGGDGTGRSFPDLHDQIVAEHGWEEGNYLWRKASAYLAEVERAEELLARRAPGLADAGLGDGA